MSLILDALKKLDQEKASRRGKVDLGPAVIRGRSVPRPMAQTILLVVVITVMVTACAIYGAMRIFRAPVDTPAAMVASAPVIPPTAALPAVTPELPPMQAPGPAPVKIQSRPVAAQPAPVRQPAARVAPVAPVAAPDGLKVTGIAWQEEREERRAVVNGTLAGEGAVIGSARINEILPDRVRFTINGQRSEVFITTPFGGDR